MNLHSNRYSAPPQLVERRVEVRETKDRVLVFQGPRRVAIHQREPEGARKRITLSEHCPPGRIRPWGRRAHAPSREERNLRRAAAEFGQLLDAVTAKHGCSIRRVRRLYRMYLDYPTEPVRESIAQALAYGLTDLERIEQMALRRIASN